MTTTTVSNSVDEASSSSSLEELNEKIQAKGDEIRQLKASGMDKQSLAPHVEELLALKAQLPRDTTSTPADPKKPQPQMVQQPNNNEKSNSNNKQQPEKELSESEIKLNRLAKVKAMREAGVEPFEYSFDVTTTPAILNKVYHGKLEPGEEDEDSDVSVAGRIMTRRVFGKLAFFSMQDESGIIQLQFDKKRLGDSFEVRCYVRVQEIERKKVVFLEYNEGTVV